LLAGGRFKEGVGKAMNYQMWNNEKNVKNEKDMILFFIFIKKVK